MPALRHWLPPKTPVTWGPDGGYYTLLHHLRTSGKNDNPKGKDDTISHGRQRYGPLKHLMQPGCIQVIDCQKNQVIREALSGGYTKSPPQECSLSALRGRQRHVRAN